MVRKILIPILGIAVGMLYSPMSLAKTGGRLPAKPIVSSTASPSPTKSAKPSPSRSATPKSSASPSKSARPTPSAKPSQSARPSKSPTATASPLPSVSPKPKPSPKKIVLPEVTLDPPPRSPMVDKALAYALLQVGKQYVRGATGPNSFDCSGLVQRAWKEAGIKLPRTSGQQFDATIHIAMTDALPGDLVFYGQDGAQHVAMYIGFGLIVEAANPAKGVVISPISTPWHNNNFGGIGRVRTPQSQITQP